MMMSLLVAATALHLPARMPSTRAAMCSRHALSMSASTSNSFLSWSECILEQEYGSAEQQQSCTEKFVYGSLSRVIDVNEAAAGARTILEEPVISSSTNHAGEVFGICHTFYSFVLHEMFAAPIFSLASSQVALAASQYKHALAKVTFARRPPDDEDEATVPSKAARRWMVVSTATASAALRRVLLT